MNIILGLLSLVAFIGIAFILSDNKKRVKLQTIIVGLLGQAVMIFFVLKVPVGKSILEAIALGFNSVIQMGMEGVIFVFGDLASKQYIFAISVLSLIVFTSALVSVLYFLRVIPFFVKYVGRAIAKVMGTSDVETFAAVGNCFLGGTEAPILIKPYLSKLTRSELFSVMATGFGSASAAILAGYSLLGIDMKYLLIATFTVPFSNLMISKTMIPEVEKSEVAGAEIQKSEASNLFEAIGEGASTGKDLALNVGAMLIAFLGLIAIINAVLGVFGTTLANVLGIVLSPLGYIFNIPANEIRTFSSLIGVKTALNEFVAYTDMSAVMANLTPRTVAILSVILCNFANFSVIGIQIGGFGVLAPERKGEVAKLGLKALISGFLATLTTGAIIGMIL